MPMTTHAKLKPLHRARRPFGVILLAVCFILSSLSLQAIGQKSSVEVVAIHAQRYQNHMANQIRCEVFGEIKNISERSLSGVTITLDYLDEKGKRIATEEMFLTLRVIAPRKPKGEARAVKPNEIGVFTQDTLNCPKQWLEGRIRYKIKSVERE